MVSVLAVWLVGKHRGPADPSPGLKAIASGYAPLWRDTRWGLVGASTIEVQNRAYVFMLEIFRTARDIAEVQAGRLLMGPLPLLVGAWGRVARPVLAKKLAAGDTRAALRIMLTGLACMTAAGLVFAVAIAVAWPLIERVIFRGRYPHVAEMTAAWTIYTLLAISHMVLSAPLIAALRLKELSHVTMVTAVVSLVLLLGLATPVSALFAVGAGIFCELIALVWIAILVHRLFRDLGRSPAPAIPQLLPAAANMGHP